MLKALRITAISAALAGTSLTAQAQFHVGAAAAFHKYSNIGLFPAAQLRVGYEFSEGKYGITGGFNYSPVSKNNTFAVTYLNPLTFETADVDFTEKVKINNYFFHANYNFGNRENNFQFGLLAGISVDLITVKYDQGDVPTGFEDEYGDIYEDATFGGPKIDLGVSGNYRVGNGKVFGELVLGLPANQVNGNAIEVSTVAHYGLQLGDQFYFGQQDY